MNRKCCCQIQTASAVAVVVAVVALQKVLLLLPLLRRPGQTRHQILQTLMTFAAARSAAAVLENSAAFARINPLPPDRTLDCHLKKKGSKDLMTENRIRTQKMDYFQSFQMSLHAV